MMAGCFLSGNSDSPAILVRLFSVRWRSFRKLESAERESDISAVDMRRPAGPLSLSGGSWALVQGGYVG
jgi:hypothetical protein